MARVRISTTVDGARLETGRRLLGVPDSQLVDRALSVLIETLEQEAELRALEAHPYEDDPELTWETPPVASLPYEGEVPSEVIELAERRRQERR